jgi:uncharacterized membrane protein YphA (DoxX/SURF4 family)
MKTLIWIITAAVIGLWSLIAWITHGLIGVAGSLISANADIVPADPLLVEWASWLASAGTGIGEWLVVAVWAVVSGLLLVAGFAATRLLPRFSSRYSAALPRASR